MRSLLNYRFQLFILIFILGFVGCKCDDPSDPDCPNYDPCFILEEPRAGFGVGQKIKLSFNVDQFGDDAFPRDTVIYTDGDTVNTNPVIYALYPETYDSVYWTVGADPTVFRNNEFSLIFSDFEGTSIPIMQVVLKESECFERGFIRDSVTKTIVIRHPEMESYFDGRYQGFLKVSPKDTFTIYFDAWEQSIINIPKDKRICCYRRNDYDELIINGGTSDFIVYGTAKVPISNRKKIVARYHLSYDGGKTGTWHTFVGRRLE